MGVGAVGVGTVAGGAVAVGAGLGVRDLDEILTFLFLACCIGLGLQGPDVEDRG